MSCAEYQTEGGEYWVQAGWTQQLTPMEARVLADTLVYAAKRVEEAMLRDGVTEDDLIRRRWPEWRGDEPG